MSGNTRYVDTTGLVESHVNDMYSKHEAYEIYETDHRRITEWRITGGYLNKKANTIRWICLSWSFGKQGKHILIVLIPSYVWIDFRSHLAFHVGQMWDLSEAMGIKGKTGHIKR